MPTQPLLKAGILIISDTAFAEPSTDKSGDTLQHTFTESGNGQWEVKQTKIIPDKLHEIQETLEQWCDIGLSSASSRFNLIITTGGTGFAIKDVTPEAVEPLLQKRAPGLVHGMLASSLEITPFAMMSRPAAGVRNGTIIVTLPGSPKGAKENLESILKLLPHACMQAAGMDSRSLHAGGVKKLEKEAGVAGGSSTDRSARPNSAHTHSHDHHSHSHTHGHVMPRAHTRPEDRTQSNDPNAGASRRYRESPYPMLSVADAVISILKHTPPARSTTVPVDTSLIGYILAEEVTATEAVPAFRASIVDGYAVIVGSDAKSTKGVFEVASVSHASPGEIPPLEKGKIARITTGAPLPPGATSVVMVEDTVLKSMTSDGKEEREVEILTDEITPGENVREVGSDIKAGEVILRKGEKISAGELGLLASVGRAEVAVYEKPVVGIMSTGDEIIQHSRPGPLRLGEVRDCNRPTIMAAVESWGYEVVDLGIAKDTPGALEADLRSAMRRVTTIITSGGVSMGELDLLKPTLERSLGGTIHFGRVSMKPGKPTTFATVPFKNNNGDSETKLVFSLPGNPASAMVTASLFVLPSLMKASGEQVDLVNANMPTGVEGWKNLGLPRATVILDEAVTCDKVREEYQRAVVRFSGNGSLRAVVTGGQRSSRVRSFRGANALVVLPAGGGTFKKGTFVEALIMDTIT